MMDVPPTKKPVAGLGLNLGLLAKKPEAGSPQDFQDEFM